MLTINPRIAIPALSLALLGIFVGNYAQENWQDRVQPHGAVVGGIAGVLLGLVLGLYLVQQRRRWIAVAVVTMLLIVAYLFGGPWNTLFVAAAVFITLFISAGILRDLYNGNEMEAFQHHLRIWLSMRGGFVVVDNGSIVVPASPGPHFGPKLIIVRPGNAVVMVNGSTVTRICGPSVFTSANFEFVSNVLPIERQRRLLAIRDALTQSYDPVSVQLTYVYGIDISAATIRGNNARTVLPNGAQGLTEPEFERLSNLVTLAPEWDTQVNRILQGATRRAIALHEYTTLTNLSYRRLAGEIKLIADEQMKEIGCCLDSVTVADIAPAPEILGTHVDGMRIRSRYLAEGEGFRLAIVSVAVGYSEAVKLGMGMEDIHREASRYMMKHMAEDPATKVVLALANPPTAGEVQSGSSVADEFLGMDARNGDQPRALG